MKAEVRVWYNNPMPYKHRKDLYAAQKRHRVKIRRHIREYLDTRSCIDCGEKDPIVLEFDHRVPEEKFKPVSVMISGHYSWKRVLAEIEKCDVRCANCHRRKTYMQFKSWGKTLPL